MTLADSSYLVFDATETVSINPQSGTLATITGVTALRRSLSLAALGISGVPLNSIVFNLFTETLSSYRPQQNDTLIDSSNRKYSVILASETTWGTRWRVVCAPHVS